MGPALLDSLAPLACKVLIQARTPGIAAVLTRPLAALSFPRVSTCQSISMASKRGEFFYVCCLLSKLDLSLSLWLCLSLCSDNSSDWGSARIVEGFFPQVRAPQ